MNKQNSTLLAYDFMLVKGGAESMSVYLCKKFPEVDLCVGFINSKIFDSVGLLPGRLFILGSITHLLGWQSLKTAYLFESRKSKIFSHYEKVIFSGSNAPLAVRHRKSGGNILYCHTPPRFIYDLKEYYFETSKWWQRPLLSLLIAYLKPKYEKALLNMDLVIANSKNVQSRLKKYNNCQSIVIYPPCQTEKYNWIEQGDFYLSTARVEPYKRVKLIVEAFINMPDKKLVVASGGSQLSELKSLASGSNNIEFVGWCEQSLLQKLIGCCIASLYLPIDEDFGISPVESMAAGKPVIGVDEGGVRETVIHNKTGYLCPRNPTVNDVMTAVSKMSKEYSFSLKQNCITHSETFSEQTFLNKMEVIINSPADKLREIALPLSSV
ncbi:glycosyltransferase [Pseudoalteromonas sp.]|uniref:glycosyltransferase n=1 Tax=Pseudoalteromonas sp. TaxID=53249 RepID=UPI0025F85411|nr:glycosyltransferase [Pseudoalteromonas sp.]|tara:strand:+ start:86057 stop:87199 length:1143 start_codon:yes stop_codon:yes gene_type:complete